MNLLRDLFDLGYLAKQLAVALIWDVPAALLSNAAANPGRCEGCTALATELALERRITARLRNLIDGLGPGSDPYLVAVEHHARMALIEEHPGDGAEHWCKLGAVIREKADHA